MIVFIAGFLSCVKEYSYEGSNNVILAEGSLTDSSGMCLNSSVHGTYYTGVTPGNDTAYVKLQVNVTKAGSYSITTNYQNGFAFADSGFFTETGLNTVLLKPVGTPLSAGAATFALNFDNSVCSFTVDIKDSTETNIPTNAWQFATDSGGFFEGTFDYISFTPDTIYGKGELGLNGLTATGDTLLKIVVLFPGNEIVPGTYYTQVVGNDIRSNSYFGFAFTYTAKVIYDAVADSSLPSKVGVTILSYDPETRIVKGSFSGIAMNDVYPLQNVTIKIEEGSFTATIP